MKILAVTVLTSFDQRDLEEMGATQNVEELVLARASGAARDRLRRRHLLRASRRRSSRPSSASACWSSRPASGRWRRPADDQKRTVDVAQAFANGADYIVVGRPIRDAADPRAAARIQEPSGGFFPS